MADLEEGEKAVKYFQRGVKVFQIINKEKVLQLQDTGASKYAEMNVTD